MMKAMRAVLPLPLPFYREYSIIQSNRPPEVRGGQGPNRCVLPK